jgi:FKBP-type peptidyl-prolyl cis-trans isomerase
MSPRTPLAALAALAALGLFACETAPPEASTASSAAPAASAAPVAQAKKGGEVVFDPNNPPPGWVNCHRNHCHHKDGRVASYAQVMQEMGATKMVGGAEPKAAPPAPPDVAAPPADAQKTPSGLASKLLKDGMKSERPGPTSVVTVHYTGWTTDGKSFDSSVARGQPAQFPVGRVIPGWTEGLQLMNVGEERRFWIPESLAYKGAAGKPAGMLVFDVELLAIQ